MQFRCSTPTYKKYAHHFDFKKEILHIILKYEPNHQENKAQNRLGRRFVQGVHHAPQGYQADLLSLWD